MTRIAIALSLALILPATSLQAQQKPFKDPTNATLWSLFIPGGGHFYSGEGNIGFALLMANVAGVSMWLYNTECDALRGCRSKNVFREIGIGLAITSWVYGIFDAGDSADRMNAANGWGLDGRPLVRPGSGGAVELGWRFPSS